MHMHVPEHIYLDGGSGNRPRNERPSVVDSEILSVPEHIILGGEGKHYSARPTPSKDFIRTQIDAISVQNNGDVPVVLTASDFQQPQAQSVESLSQSYIAIDENPAKELKVLRRCLGHISTRLLSLEEENSRRQTREIGLWAVLAGAFVMLGFLFANRGR